LACRAESRLLWKPRRLLRYGFEDLGLNRSARRSAQSRLERVLQKIGMRYEARRQEHVKRWDP
jgi:hypothetical protein